MTDTNTAAALSAETDGLTDLEDAISDAISDSMDMDWTYRDGAKAVVRVLVDQDWLTRRLATDPDIPCEAGGHVATPAPAALEGSSLGEGETRVTSPLPVAWVTLPGLTALQEAALAGRYEYIDAGSLPGHQSVGLYASVLKDDAVSAVLTMQACFDEVSLARDRLAEENAALRALQPSSAADAKPVAEPEGWLIERLEGRGYGPARRIVDAQQYDPTSPDHWISDEAQQRHRVTALYAQPHPSQQGGAEASFVDAEARAEAWSDRIEIQDMIASTTEVFAAWASPEILSRFRQQMAGVIQQAFIEGVADEADRLAALKPVEG